MELDGAARREDRPAEQMALREIMNAIFGVIRGGMGCTVALAA